MHLRSGGKQAKLKELSNNISDRSKAKGTGIMSDLLLVNGEARQLVANPHYTILLALVSRKVCLLGLVGSFSSFSVTFSSDFLGSTV